MNQLNFPYRNMLLHRLAPADLDLLQPLERIDLPLRQMLETANVPIEWVYFIEDGLASVVHDKAPKGPMEIGIVGREGMSGLGLLYGDAQTPFETFMQVAGSAMRCPASRVAAALAVSPTLRDALLPFARAFSIQVAATAVANGSASLRERLARWLLMVGERVGPTFHITHEFLSIMLGVHRPGVTLALQGLEGMGLIRSGRATISVLDRQGLIKTAGSSFGLAEQEYQRLLGGST